MQTTDTTAIESGFIEVARAAAEGFSLTVKADSGLARGNTLEAVGCAKAAAEQLRGLSERLDSLADSLAQAEVTA